MEAAFQSGFASALLDILFNKVTDVVIVELRKIIGSDAALGKLQTTVLQAQKLLNQVDTFEMQEDMMDDIFHMIPDKHHSSFYDKPVLKAILPSPRNWSKPRNILKLQNKLDAILTELEALVELAVQPESETAGVSNGHRMPNMEMSLPLRNNDVGDIVQELISRKSKCHGVSIVGIDGLGKTTVALHVRDEALISTNFASRLWVDVLGCFSAEHILQQLDQLHSTDSCSNNAEDRLQSILIIFDNLLEVKLVEWNVFWSHVVTKGINGRRYKNIKFLITTFNPRVARNTRTSSHYLKPLSDENCEKVIIATAKSHNQHLSGMHFQHAASLAKKCGGLPSVASILGVVLAQYNAEDVHNILNGDLWDSILFKEEVFPALKSCYTKIQSQLKRCLAYFSLFPHNYSFTVDELVQLWIGEGFFQETQGAKDHFTDLLGMSILRLSDQMSPSGMPKYELNAFGHKFAQLAASRTCLRLVQGLPPSNFNTTRHLSYRDHIGFPVWDNLKKLKGLRTFLSVCKTSINPIPPACPIPACAFKTLTRLRVLSLSQTDVSKLPDSISYLKHLHYLDVSRTAIKTLPETLSELHTLQFLKLVKDKGNLEYLPKHFQNLTNLLYIDWEISDIRHMGLPTNIGHLTNKGRGM